MCRTEYLFAQSILFFVSTIGLCGCGGNPDKGINVKSTVQVTGKVLVDGVPPDTMIRVKAYLAGGNPDSKQPVSSGGTDKDGVFALNTYSSGDGIPLGEYKLTFLWGKANLFGGGMQGADQLGGRYFDPKSSPFSVTITESDDTLDIGVFELEKAAQPAQIPDDRVDN